MIMVSPDQRLTVILAAIALVTGVLGWLIRSVLGNMRTDTTDNTAAIRDLTQEFNKFRLQLAEQQAAEARAAAAAAAQVAAAAASAASDVASRAATARSRRRWWW